MFCIHSSQLHGSIRQLCPYLSNISLKLQQSSLSPCPLQIKVLFVFSSHFIFLYSLSLSLTFPTFFLLFFLGLYIYLEHFFFLSFLFFDSFLLEWLKAQMICFLSFSPFFSLLLWALSCSLLVPTQALWSLFILSTLSHIVEVLEEGQEKNRNFLRHINIHFGEKSLISL